MIHLISHEKEEKVKKINKNIEKKWNSTWIRSWNEIFCFARKNIFEQRIIHISHLNRTKGNFHRIKLTWFDFNEKAYRWSVFCTKRNWSGTWSQSVSLPVLCVRRRYQKFSKCRSPSSSDARRRVMHCAGWISINVLLSTGSTCPGIGLCSNNSHSSLFAASIGSLNKLLLFSLRVSSLAFNSEFFATLSLLSHNCGSLAFADKFSLFIRNGFVYVTVVIFVVKFFVKVFFVIFIALWSERCCSSFTACFLLHTTSLVWCAAIWWCFPCCVTRTVDDCVVAPFRCVNVVDSCLLVVASLVWAKFNEFCFIFPFDQFKWHSFHVKENKRKAKSEKKNRIENKAQNVNVFVCIQTHVKSNKKEWKKLNFLFSVRAKKI